MLFLHPDHIRPGPDRKPLDLDSSNLDWIIPQRLNILYNTVWDLWNLNSICENTNRINRSRVAFIFCQDLVLMMGESNAGQSLFQHIPKILDGAEVWTLWGPIHVWKGCSLNHSFTMLARLILALSSWNMSVPSGKKHSIDGKTWSFSIFRWSADLILWKRSWT